MYVSLCLAAGRGIETGKKMTMTIHVDIVSAET